MEEVIPSGEHGQIKFVSKRSPDYKLEFINSALSNLTPRGEIVCEFQFESKDRPTEQIATIVGNGIAKLSPFIEDANYTRDIKFGIIINIPFAKDLVRMLNEKIKESEDILAARRKGEIERESTL